MCLVWLKLIGQLYVVCCMACANGHSQSLHVNYPASRSSQTDTQNRNHEPLPRATAGRQSLIAHVTPAVTQFCATSQLVSQKVQCVEG